MEQINIIGEKILNIVLTAAYWVTLIGGAGQVINSIAKKDTHSALKNAMSYGIAFASIFVLRWMLNLIRSTFL